MGFVNHKATAFLFCSLSQAQNASQKRNAVPLLPVQPQGSGAFLLGVSAAGDAAGYLLLQDVGVGADIAI